MDTDPVKARVKEEVSRAPLSEPPHSRVRDADGSVANNISRSQEHAESRQETELFRHDGWIAGRVGTARITKVGLWIALLTLVLSVAAANTGNNSLYLLISSAGSLLLAAWWVARRNVRGLELLVRLPDELYAGVPVLVHYRVRRRKTGVAADLLLLIEGSRSGALLRDVAGQPAEDVESRSTGLAGFHRQLSRVTQGLPHQLRWATGKRGDVQQVEGDQQLLFLRRGLHRVGQARILSLFPMGLFRRYVLFSASREVIVLPEIFAGVRVHKKTSPRGWREAGRRSGHSEGLHSLREFRPGDDPRSIHWKQSARNPQLIFQERSEDEARRVSVLVDSLVPAVVVSEESRFERLVSEAATACVEYLERGYEVELVLREGTIEFGVGRWHRKRLLEALALLQFELEDQEDEERQQGSTPMALAASDGESHELRFSLSSTLLDVIEPEPEDSNAGMNSAGLGKQQ